MNPTEYVLDNLGRPIAGCQPSPYTLEKLENGDSSSAGVGWIGLVEGFKVNCSHVASVPTERVPSVGVIFLSDPSPYLSKFRKKKTHWNLQTARSTTATEE